MRAEANTESWLAGINVTMWGKNISNEKLYIT